MIPDSAPVLGDLGASTQVSTNATRLLRWGLRPALRAYGIEPTAIFFGLHRRPGTSFLSLTWRLITAHRTTKSTARTTTRCSQDAPPPRIFGPPRAHLSWRHRARRAAGSGCRGWTNCQARVWRGALLYVQYSRSSRRSERTPEVRG